MAHSLDISTADSVVEVDLPLELDLALDALEGFSLSSLAFDFDQLQKILNVMKHPPSVPALKIVLSKCWSQIPKLVPADKTFIAKFIHTATKRNGLHTEVKLLEGHLSKSEACEHCHDKLTDEVIDDDRDGPMDLHPYLCQQCDFDSIDPDIHDGAQIRRMLLNCHCPSLHKAYFSTIIEGTTVFELRIARPFNALLAKVIDRLTIWFRFLYENWTQVVSNTKEKRKQKIADCASNLNNIRSTSFSLMLMSPVRPI